MTEKNRDYVAVHADRDVMYWALVMPSDATTCEEQAGEILDRCETLFATFEEFIVPTQVELSIGLFPPGQSLPVGMRDDDCRETMVRELENPDGITAADVREAARVSAAGDRWLPKVFVTGTAVEIRLDDGDVRADRTEHTVEYMQKRQSDRDPTVNPIQMTLLHAENVDDPEVDSDFVSSLLVSPFSDIWFEDSAVGRKNRERLAAFLERVERTLPVEVVKRTSDWLPVEELEAIY